MISGQGRAERSLLAIALLAVASAFVLYLSVVRTFWGQRLDEHAFAGRTVIGGRSARGADDLLSAISVGTLTLAIVALVGLALLRRRPGLALLSLVVVGGSLIITEVLKLGILTRPHLVATFIPENSYPSGHSTIGIAVGLSLILVAPPRLRTVAAAGAAAIAASVGIATVAAGWHRPSDAVGAYLVALAVAATATAAMLRWWPTAAPAADDPRSRISPSKLRGHRPRPDELILGGLAIVGGGLFCLAVLRAQGVPWTSAGVGFLLSAAAIGLAAVLAVVGLLFGLSRIEAAESAAPPESRRL